MGPIVPGLFGTINLAGTLVEGGVERAQTHA